MEKEILKVLIGSQAHGLATPESDFDYRAVFVVPTSEILKIGGDPKSKSWIEEKEDNTSWEIGHFLRMAVKCNPTILECFLAPQMPYADTGHEHPLGDELRALFPYVWNSKDVANAFVGYGLQQRKRFLDDRENRVNKFAVAYLRSLYQGYELLTTGTFTIRIVDTEIGEMLVRWKRGEFDVGEVIGTCHEWEQKCKKAFADNPSKETNMGPVNAFLLKIRKENW